MPTRRASHAGSWYSADKRVLDAELDSWLAAVGDEIDAVSVPVPGARIIIAPHAGYSYSGPAAAYAYKAWDLSRAKRVFVLGPSHHLYLDSLALSPCDTYATPLGPLHVDTATIAALAALHATCKFTSMSVKADEAEHSLEMHLPYIHKMLSRVDKLHVPIVPIMVGAVARDVEKAFGIVLAPYLADPENAFVVSTDFCHWGTRFDYTHYYPVLPAPASAVFPTHLKLGPRVAPPRGGPAIWESIAALDKQGMAAVTSASHDTFVDYLAKTRNTVCGRHPIGVVMAAIEAVAQEEEEEEEGKVVVAFRWVRYEQSSEVVNVRESSVSYAAAYCVL